MATLLYDLVGRLRASLRSRENDLLEDAELLGRWVRDRDQSAFELLVWRHGRLVLGVCQRLLSGADVEDAFQATFLLLVRKAASIKERQALASWLHTVAYRVALEARKRQARNPRGADSLEWVADDRRQKDGELLEVLDAEVQRLPEKYRRPFVLCCLEGRSNEEAARELDRPVGTVVSQLSRARDRLRAQLLRRGLAPAALLGILGRAEVSARMVQETLQAAVEMGSKASIAAATRAAATVLMEGALRSMMISKLKFMTVFLAGAVCLGTGGSAIGYRVVSAQQPGGPPATRPAPAGQARAPEIQHLRDQLQKAQEQVARLTEALREMEAKTAATGGSTPNRTGPTAERTRLWAVVVDPDEIRLLQIRLEAKKAELAAANAMAQEAQKRLTIVEKQVENKVMSAEDLGAARSTALRYQAEVRLKEAELAEAMIQLKRLERLAGGRKPGGTPPRSLEERFKALEEQHQGLKGELDRLREELRSSRPGR